MVYPLELGQFEHEVGLFSPIFLFPFREIWVIKWPREAIRVETIEAEGHG